MKALILSSNECGVSHDLEGTLDGNPDRTEITLKPIDCTLDAFLDALEDADEDGDFAVHEDGTISDIGGFEGSLEPGHYLCVEDGSIFVASS